MPAVISFIGWHNSGKTTLASKVVAGLKNKGYSVGVIKSTKETAIETDQPHTDTSIYAKAGADAVALLAPDQLVYRERSPQYDLPALVQRLFIDKDIVIAEGFKSALGVKKIEVRRDENSPLLRDQVEGVVAIVTDFEAIEGNVFRFDQFQELVDFIENLLLPAQRTMTNK